MRCPCGRSLNRTFPRGGHEASGLPRRCLIPEDDRYAGLRLGCVAADGERTGMTLGGGACLDDISRL